MYIQLNSLSFHYISNEIIQVLLSDKFSYLHENQIIMTLKDEYHLHWKEFETNIHQAFRELREEKELFDVSLVCDDSQIPAHKVILSACSPFFRRVLGQNPHPHPLIFIKGVKFKELQNIINFMYMGEVSLAQDELKYFLQVAQELKVKGIETKDTSSVDTFAIYDPVAKNVPHKSKRKLSLMESESSGSEDESIINASESKKIRQNGAKKKVPAESTKKIIKNRNKENKKGEKFVKNTEKLELEKKPMYMNEESPKSEKHVSCNNDADISVIERDDEQIPPISSSLPPYVAQPTSLSQHNLEPEEYQREDTEDMQIETEDNSLKLTESSYIPIQPILDPGFEEPLKSDIDQFYSEIVTKEKKPSGKTKEAINAKEHIQYHKSNENIWKSPRLKVLPKKFGGQEIHMPKMREGRSIVEGKPENLKPLEKIIGKGCEAKPGWQCNMCKRIFSTKAETVKHLEEAHVILKTSIYFKNMIKVV